MAAQKPAERLRKINPKALSLTCQQFAIILKAGLPLVRTVDLVAEQCTDKTLKRLLQQVSADVTDGWAMSRSIEVRSQGKLPVTFQETVRAGEESGDLVASFERLSEYFDRMAKTRSSVVGALIYPAFLAAVAAALTLEAEADREAAARRAALRAVPVRAAVAKIPPSRSLIRQCYSATAKRLA